MRWEDVLVQRCLAIFDFHHGFIKEGESKGVSSGKDNDVDGLFLWGSIKYDGVFLHLLYAWLDEHSPGDDAAWELVVYHVLFQLCSEQTHRRERSASKPYSSSPAPSLPGVTGKPCSWLGRGCQSFFSPLSELKTFF